MYVSYKISNKSSHPLICKSYHFARNLITRTILKCAISTNTYTHSTLTPFLLSAIKHLTFFKHMGNFWDKVPENLTRNKKAHILFSPAARFCTWLCFASRPIHQLHNYVRSSTSSPSEFFFFFKKQEGNSLSAH